MASNDWFEIANTSTLESTDDPLANPANGLSMVGGSSGFDLCGSLYGCDFSNHGYDLMAPMTINDDWSH